MSKREQLEIEKQKLREKASKTIEMRNVSLEKLSRNRKMFG